MNASKGIQSYKTCANINKLTFNTLHVGKFGMLLWHVLLLFKRLDNASVPFNPNNNFERKHSRERTHDLQV